MVINSVVAGAKEEEGPAKEGPADDEGEVVSAGMSVSIVTARGGTSDGTSAAGASSS